MSIAMGLDPANASSASHAGIIARIRSLNFDQIMLGSAIMALVVAVVTLAVSVYQTALTLKGIQYQNAIALLDQSNEIAERLRERQNYLDVLSGKDSSSEGMAAVEVALEPYQTQIFKAALLKDKGFMPDDIWFLFVEDFCELYDFDFIKGWWGRQRNRPIYASKSPQYRVMSDLCLKLPRGGK